MSSATASRVERMSVIETEPEIRVLQTPQGPVEVAVRGRGPAVLALHGAMGGYDQGLILADTVGPKDFQYIAPSRPGYLGTPLRSGQTAEEQADLCVHLLDQLGIDKAAALAVSGGGPCAVQFALRHPDRCWALVMISAASATIAEHPPFRWQVMKFVARFPALVGWMGRGMEKNRDRNLEREVPDAAQRARLLASADAMAVHDALQRSVFERMGERIAGTQNDIDQTRGPMPWPLERIAVPTFAMHGTRDQMAPFEHSRALCERVRGAEFMPIENGEHVAIFTHHDAVKERVERFLRAHAPGLRAP